VAGCARACRALGAGEREVILLAALLGGRLRGWREAGGLERRPIEDEALLDIGLREALALRRRRRA